MAQWVGRVGITMATTISILANEMVTPAEAHCDRFVSEI